MKTVTKYKHVLTGDFVEKSNDEYYKLQSDGRAIPARLIENSKDWLPYTAPQEEVKWKTFLMVVQHHKSHIPYQVIIRCKSIEDAKIIHKNAISITEVEIDIREK